MSVFERLLTSAPVNKQAAMHLAKNGEHYKEPERHDKLVIASDIFLPSRAPSAAEAANPSFTDLAGVTYGRLRVMGILDHERAGITIGKTAPRKWVVRCVCGRFETRNAKAIRAAHPDNAHCRHCQHQAWLRANAHKPKWSDPNGGGE